jgi:hypothetical protein
MPASDLPAIHQLLAPAYQEGMNHGKRPAALAEIETGYIGSLVIRSAFTSPPFREPIPSLTDDYLDLRTMLTRFITDLGLQMCRASCSVPASPTRDRRPSSDSESPKFVS